MLLPRLKRAKWSKTTARFVSEGVRHISSEDQLNRVSVGHTFSLKRCFGMDDVRSFCLLCNIAEPDLEAAHKNGVSRCRVPELLYAGLFPAIIGANFPGSIYVSQKLQFRVPVLIEENLYAEVKVDHLRGFREKHRVELTTLCWKEENNVLVVDGVAVALFPTLLAKASRY